MAAAIPQTEERLTRAMVRRWTKPRAMITFTGLILWFPISVAAAQEYPEASLDQATYKTMCSLTIDRYAGRNEEALQAEYQWALDMAELCLNNAPAVPDQAHVWMYAVEFQRHAGRTARYRGFGEQAVQDYERAIEYVYRVEDLFPPVVDPPEDWETMVLRDIADTYLLMGAYEAAEQTNDLIGRMEVKRQRGRGEPPSDLAVELARAAQIATRRGRVAQAVGLQRRAVRAAEQRGIPRWLETIPEVEYVVPTRPWTEIVRREDVRRALSRHQPKPNDLRETYCHLARSLRLNRQLGDAGYALATAELTPWQTVDRYRENLDLYVDRERALLALDRGEAGEAVRRGNKCLSKHAASIHPSERVELLDLVSRGLEQTGDLRGAFDRLKEAITIVEDRRANLFEDEHKQLYVAGYTPLYRRALELVILINAANLSPALREDGAPGDESRKSKADSRKPLSAFDFRLSTFDRQAIGESFEWAERIKARAMFDTLNRYGRRMAVAASNGDTGAAKGIRDLTGEVVSIEKIRDAPWWPADTALVEFAYGGEEGTGESRKQKVKSRKTGGGDEGTRGGGAVYVWVVRAERATFHRLDAEANEIDENCAALAKALGRYDARDRSWAQPARWLYEHTIAPVMADLGGIERLIIVGDGKLRTVPFETFVVSRDAYPERPVAHRLLVEDFAISYAPSATLLDTISREPQRKEWGDALWAFASTRFGDNTALGGTRESARDESRGSDNAQSASVGDYKLIMRAARSVSLADLPRAGKEVRQIASGFDSKTAKVFIDEPNMKGKLLTAARDGTLQSTRFLHFATHAFVDPQRPYLAGLVLSPPYPIGESRKQKVESRKTGRGLFANGIGVARAGRAALLTVGEIGGLDLGCELVVLSACHTLGDDAVDGDWINGLTRAFLVGGCSGVVCSTWEAPDRAALSIMPSMYHALRRAKTPNGGIDVPRALQAMKRSRLRSRQFAHPSIWSPWVYFGRVHPVAP